MKKLAGLLLGLTLMSCGPKIPDYMNTIATTVDDGKFLIFYDTNKDNAADLMLSYTLTETNGNFYIGKLCEERFDSNQDGAFVPGEIIWSDDSE
jgi:hypothetical protein